eukprot:4429233-Pleurochrysis_carterae.AAC.6
MLLPADLSKYETKSRCVLPHSTLARKRRSEFELSCRMCSTGRIVCTGTHTSTYLFWGQTSIVNQRTHIETSFAAACRMSQRPTLVIAVNANFPSKHSCGSLVAHCPMFAPVSSTSAMAAS